jgi:hypothetical protein
LRYLSGTRNGYGIPLASNEWGGFTYFIEIEDQHVKRQVNRHANGTVVRYDRTHWCDDFGFMFVGRFSRKQKAGRGMSPLTAAEFERVWFDALSSPTWREQIARSREKAWGTWAERVTS